jgi:ketosteroid isomerase-like protein
MRFDSTFGRGGMRVALGLAVACLAAAAAQPAGPEEAAVLAAQKERLQAMVRSDLDALGRLLPDDLTYTHASGVADTKASLLASIAAGKLKYKSFDPGQPRVRVYGNTAVLTGTATVQVESATIGPAPFQILFTDVYVRKPDGRWQAVAWQSTRPPAPPSPAP